MKVFQYIYLSICAMAEAALLIFGILSLVIFILDPDPDVPIAMVAAVTACAMVLLGITVSSFIKAAKDREHPILYGFLFKGPVLIFTLGIIWFALGIPEAGWIAVIPSVLLGALILCIPKLKENDKKLQAAQKVWSMTQFTGEKAEWALEDAAAEYRRIYKRSLDNRIDNHIDDCGMIDRAEEWQLIQQLRALAENPKQEGQAKTLLTKLYNHQAEQYRLLAVSCGKEAVEKSGGDRDAISELANAWDSYIPDWNVRNHHALIEWFSDYCRRNPENRAAVMWLLDNLIDDHRLAEARQWLEKLEALDDTFRTVMYRYMIAQAAGEKEESEKLLCQLETMEGQEWCRAVTLGDIYTLRQEYDKAIEWYRKGQEMQPSPKFTDSAASIAHICEIRGDRAGAIEAYREVMRLQQNEWGIISGELREEVERAIQRLS